MEAKPSLESAATEEPVAPGELLVSRSAGSVLGPTSVALRCLWERASLWALVSFLQGGASLALLLFLPSPWSLSGGLAWSTLIGLGSLGALVLLDRHLGGGEPVPAVRWLERSGTLVALCALAWALLATPGLPWLLALLLLVCLISVTLDTAVFMVIRGDRAVPALGRALRALLVLEGREARELAPRVVQDSLLMIPGLVGGLLLTVALRTLLEWAGLPSVASVVFLLGLSTWAAFFLDLTLLRYFTGVVQTFQRRGLLEPGDRELETD